MSIAPIITFKAGICDVDSTQTPPKVNPRSAPGYIFLYSEDDLVHFCWRPRSASLNEPELDLVMVPSDGNFIPYEYNKSDSSKSPTNGRVYVLKFSSSSQRHLFWLQSKSQHPQGNASWFSPRDLKLGNIVDQLLQGEEINVREEIANLPNDQGGDGDHDETMEDAEGMGGGPEHHRAGSGGAGADATGGDIREEGEGAREGGADGGRAATAPTSSAAAAVQNFLQSLQGNQALASPSQGKTFTTLPDLLLPSSAISMVESSDESFVNNLLTYVPSTILLLEQESSGSASTEPTPESSQNAIEALSLDQKKNVLIRILRSPQFSQSLGSLTMALRDGGLPSISDALKIRVENGGFFRNGAAPIGGGEAVEAFLKGIKASVEEEEQKTQQARMDTD